MLPARDAEKTVATALRSVLRSRGVALEVVVVNHGSADATASIIKRLADGRVRVIDVDGAVPLATALNRGIAACASPLVARMDADDVMHPDRLRADVDWLSTHNDTSAVACRIKLIPRGDHGSLAMYVAWQNATMTAADHAREIWVEQPVCQPATTFRRAALEGVPYRAGDFPEDYDLFLRLLAGGARIEKRPAVHHAWRRHAATTTRWSRDVLAALKARALVQRFQLANRRVVVAGAGKEGGRIARALIDAGAPPSAFLDVAARRIGRTRHGVRVLDARELPSLRAAPGGCFVVAAVGTSGARGVVRAQLAGAGCVEGEDCVVVA